MGKVFFVNADDGGASYTFTHETDIEKWSDSEIVLYVPSVIGSDCDMTSANPAGTGRFIIETPENNGVKKRLESTSPLKIPYAIMNVRSPEYDNCGALRLHLTKDNEDPYNAEGYIFEISNTANSADPNLINCMADYFCQWNAVSGIQFVMSTTPTNLSQNEFADFKNGIHYFQTGNRPFTLAFTLNTTPSRINLDDPDCLGSGYFDDRALVTSKEIDIYVNALNYPTVNCLTDPDLPYTLLHEIGHALTLHHILPDGQLMYYAYEGVGIGANEIMGSVDAATNSQDLHANCDDQAIVTGTLTTCTTTGTTDDFYVKKKFSIYPVLFSTSNTLDFTFIGAEHLQVDQVRIWDVYGRSQSLSSWSLDAVGLQIQTDQVLHSGVYWLQLFYKDQLLKTQKIIIQ